MKAIGFTIRFIVFSNLFIAGCVLCFTAKTSLIMFGNNGNIHVNLLAFFATSFLYGFHGIYGSRHFEGTTMREQQKYNREPLFKRLNYFITPIAFLLALSQLFYMPYRVFTIIAPAALIAFGYSIPFIKVGNKHLRLRDISWFKALWIAFSYAWLTTCLPIAFVLPLKDLWHPQIAFIFIRNFLFVFAITIPFDIRDMETDLKNGLRTLPLRLGVKGSINIALAGLIVFLASAFFQVYFHRLSLPIFFALFISTLETALVITLSSPKKSILFFPFAIEGSMVFQWALLYFLLCLKI